MLLRKHGKNLKGGLINLSVLCTIGSSFPRNFSPCQNVSLVVCGFLLSPLSLPTGGHSPSPSVSHCVISLLAVFQSPSPGSSSPLGAESSSTALHPSDPSEASTNKEVGCCFVSYVISSFFPF